MLKNYFKIAWRNLVKHKVFSLISIASLMVGTACCMLLLLYIKDETSYDRHHTHAKDLYRVTTSFHNIDGTPEAIATSSPPIVMTMLSEFPEVINAARIVSPPGAEENLIQYEEQSFFESKGLLADSTFFQMFDYEFAEGNPAEALKQPNSVVLTQTLAHKIFGDRSGLGETISISNNAGEYDYKITGILKDTDKKSHIEANFITSMSSEGLGKFITSITNWGGQNFIFSYIQLHPEASAEVLEAKLPAFLNKYGAKDLKELGMNKSLHLQPVTDIHLKSSFNFDLGQNGSIIYIYVMSAIAIFMQLIACINFMNLSTAKAAQRAGEVGVRKTLGANQATLVKQFLNESMLLVVVAILLSILLVELLLPYFNHLTGKSIGFQDIGLQYYVLSAIALTLVTGLLAGSYPAFFLSSFQPAKVLKGKINMQRSGGLLRKSLVVFQFVVAICLISGVIIIVSQLDYMRHQALGFETSSRIVIPLRTSEASERFPALKAKLSQQTGIQQVSASSVIPGRKVLHDFSLYPAGSNMENGIYCQRYFVDPDFTELLHLKILQGKDFGNNPNDGQDHRILINQTALSAFNFSQEDAIGQKLYTEWEGEVIEFEVIGVVNDFHHASLHQDIGAMVFHPSENEQFSYAIASAHPADMQQTLGIIQQSWKEVNPELPFEYTFLDQHIQQLYEDDQKMSQIIGSFTLVAILISCLGLYGLSAFVAERKVKEIGIRKVFGAQVITIVGLLSRDFTKLVLMAFLISVPLSYYIMQQWLQHFAYQIEIGARFFILAGLVALLIAWVTVSYHAIRAALANPVKSLRSE